MWFAHSSLARFFEQALRRLQLGPRWDKTQARDWLPGFVYLMHIRQLAVVDAIAPPGVTTDNVEVFSRVELRLLHWREPFSQEGYPTGLSGVHHRLVALAQS